MSQSVQQGWLDFAAAMQATLSKSQNRGLAIVTVVLTVKGLDVKMWEEAEVIKLSPLALINGGSEVDAMVRANMKRHKQKLDFHAGVKVLEGRIE